MGGVDSITGLIDSNKKYIEWLLIILIVVEFMPAAFFGFDVGSTVKNTLRPVSDFMKHGLVQFLVFVLLLWTCCVKRDMNMFVLLSVFLLATR